MVFAMGLIASSIWRIVRDNIVFGVLIHMRIDISLVLSLADVRGTEIVGLRFGLRMTLSGWGLVVTPFRVVGETPLLFMLCFVGHLSVVNIKNLLKNGIDLVLL